MDGRNLTCHFCKKKFPWAGQGRRPRYCKPAHRQRAYERRRRNPFEQLGAQLTKDFFERRAMEELQGVWDSPPDMRAELYNVRHTIHMLQIEIGKARVKYKLLKKRLKNAPKPHAQLAREVRRAVDDALGGAEL